MVFWQEYGERERERERRGRASLEGVFFVMTGSTGGKTDADWLEGVHRPDTVAALGKCRVRDKLIYLYLSAGCG